MSRSNLRAHHQRHFSFYILHRYLGFLVALFVLLLAITGIMLNHTEALRLDERQINSGAMRDWYGIDAEVPENGYQLGKHWVSHQGQSVFYNDDLLDASLSELTGVVSANNLLVLSSQKKIILLTPAGELVDVIDHNSGLPAGKIIRLGLSQYQRAVLETDEGRFIASSEFLNWKKNSDLKVNWPRQKALPDSLKMGISQNWLGEGISLERLLLDLHSGRLFGGSWGVLLMDLAAFLMILLTITGLWLWLNRLRKRIIHNRAYKHHRRDK